MSMDTSEKKGAVDVGMVIVNFYSEQYIVNLLNTIKKKRKTDFEVIIVSNSGPFKGAGELKYDFNINIVESKNNIGFARACNMGVKNTNAKYIMFINPDVLITPEIIDRLFEIHENNPDSGAVKPIVGGERIIFKEPHELRPIKDINIGSTFMISRDLFWEIGGFDETYFLWYEDTDIRDRILKTGKPVHMVDNIVLPHVNMCSTYHVPEDMGKFLVKAWMCSHVNYLNSRFGIIASLFWCLAKISKSMYLLAKGTHPEAPHKKYPGTAVLFGLRLVSNFFRIKKYVVFDGIQYFWGGKPKMINM